MNPKISLITPAYNESRFLEEAVESVKRQSLDSLLYEWVIVDDGSSDETFNNLKKSMKDMENSRVFSRNKNLGTSQTREEAISLSRGDYIAFFDLDDLLYESALESTLKFMEDNPSVRLSYSKHERIDSQGNFIEKREGHEYSRDKLLHFNFIGHLKCLDRKLHYEIGGFDKNFSRYSEDYDYILRASEKLSPEQIKRNPRTLYKYRIHPQNNMNKKDKMKQNAEKAINASLKRGENVDADVFWSHITPDKYNYYDWYRK